MEFYVIPPNSKLELMNFGQRFFCLAQHYYASEEYRNFFKARKVEGKWITLDNGAGDHSLITEDILMWCLKDLMPSEVIPLDILFDSYNTLNNLDTFIDRLKKEELIDKVEIFACPQGNTRQEWIDCYLEMIANPYVKTIGMSKLGIPHAFLGEAKNDQGIMESRHMAVKYLLENELIQKPLHFLGMGSPLEYVWYKELNNPLLRSSDSCNSIWSGMNNLDWSKDQFDRIPTPKDFFERKMTDDQVQLAKSNIAWFKDLNT